MEDIILKTLSAREIEILKLFKAGLNNREIAQEVFIAEKTVRFHLTSIYKKFNIDNGDTHHKGRKLMAVIWRNGILNV